MGGSKKVRVAHELPTDRRKIIKKALEEHESEARHDWDRENEWKPVRFFRKIVKPGQSRTVQLPLLMYLWEINGRFQLQLFMVLDQALLSRLLEHYTVMNLLERVLAQISFLPNFLTHPDH